MAKQATVCIVDDDPGIRSMLVRASQRKGFTTVEASSGVGLVDKLAGKPEPWLIFMDIHMGERDGIEAIEDLRDLPNDLTLRFMTGGSEAHAVAARMIANARDLKVSRTLFKPFSMAEFDEALGQAVD